jgi:adenylosuccinate lyase
MEERKIIGEEPIVPLKGRYASKEMKSLFTPDESIDYRYQCYAEIREIFSDKAKYSGWRRNWVILAECEKELGLNITDEQLAALKAKEHEIDFKSAASYEKILKHDVMAYLKEFADRVNEVCPGAGGILHEGATSMCISDNEEILAMKKGLQLIYRKAVELRDTTGADVLTPAIEELDYRSSSLKARGLKGATGTQASYLGLFRGDHDKVITLDRMFSEKLGFSSSYTVTSQTYPRIVDYQILGSLATLPQTLFHMSGEGERAELQTHFTDIHNKSKQAAQMASIQWLERSLDDSSERRIIISESFYQIDNILEKMLKTPERLINTHNQDRLSQTKRDGLKLISEKLANSVDKIHAFAEKYRDTVCTGFTHGQFAQPVTYGKRLDMWAYNFVLALKDLENILEKEYEMYTPVLDYMINTRLNQVAIASAKMANDIRLLQHDLEVNEPFGKSQVGSSAMAYKRNPMKCERINGLSRNKIGSTNESRLADYDWLCTDAILELVLTVMSGDTEEQTGFVVHKRKAEENLTKYMPFLASEDILLAATDAGGNRQELHEKVRLASLEAQNNIDQGGENNVLELLARYGFDVDLANKKKYLDPHTHVGRSKEQVDEFFEKEVKPIRERYNDVLGKTGKVQI